MILHTGAARGARILAALLSLCLLFASCDAVSGGYVMEDADDTVSFTDALGRAVKVKKNPERVAALLGSFADVWMLSGGELCAAAEDAWDDFALPLDGALSLGGAHSPSAELLISAEPDLVLASASTASNVEMKDMLEAMGITVVYFDVCSFDDYLRMLDVCTAITGRRDLYEKNGLEIKAAIDGIKARYKESDVPEEERRILLLRASSTTVKAKGSEGTVLGEMLRDMGCINIADGDGGLLENLSIEEIMRCEPYHIFATTMGGDTQKALEQLEGVLSGSLAWSSLEAVRSGRVHVMDKKLFNLKPNAKWGESYERLYEILTEE